MNAKLRRAHDLGFADAMSWEATLRHAGIELTKGEWCRERRERLENEIRALHPDWTEQQVRREGARQARE
jgi:hypothetical protein